MAEEKIALFGGTFDPIHIGHTAIAASAAEHISAEKVIFIPANRSALKESSPVAGDTDRFEMVRLAISKNSKFALSDYELKKSGPSYTLETVRHFKQQYDSGTIFYWLLGADSVDDLPLWYNITELIDECNLSVMFRAGYEKPDFSRFVDIWGIERVKKLQRNVIQTPLVDVSSTEIRASLAAGENINDLLCPEVQEYISKKSLYIAQADI